MRLFKLGFLIVLVVATRVGYPQTSQGGQLPAFFTGTRNGLDLCIAADPGHRIASYTLTIGGQTAHAKTFPAGQEPTKHTLHVTWDATAHFRNGDQVAYQVSGETKLADGSLVAFDAISAARTVYSERALHLQQNLPDCDAIRASAQGGLGYTAHELVERYDNTWTAANYADDATGSIRLATHIVTYCHGHEGVLNPPGGGTVGASPVTSATSFGQPDSRPPTQFALIATCSSFANPAFGDAYLVGAPVVGRAAIGFKQTVTSQEASLFIINLLDEMVNGVPLETAAEAAFQSAFVQSDRKTFESVVSVRGDPYAKLKGVYTGTPQATKDWKRVIEEG
ncbi:MAG: hypothetical protein KIS66_15855 [Fimbriimonadaceae bacterium]|nr:hypothetical protein [Fimbriimonadaceae bacterium]